MNWNTDPRLPAVAEPDELSPVAVEQLFGDIRALIEEARSQVARAVNVGLVSLYWWVGSRIMADILQHERAGYGEQIVATLSRQLVAEYGRGFTRDGVFRMIRFAQCFPDQPIVATLSRQLTWSHFREVIQFDDPLQREFYTEMCRIERWSVRTLRDKIRGMLFERTAVSRKPEELIRQELAALRDEDRMTPDLVFRSPYILNFLGLADTYSERDLEAAILRELERFILELGTDFTFVARQKRITIGKEDFYLDLLFFNRRLRRLFAIDLKLGRFMAEHKGKMELYLRWLDRHERREWEESPLGLIFCTEADLEQIELLQLDQGTIRVAEYLTELPPRALLEARLREAVRLARAQIAARPERTEGEPPSCARPREG